MQPHLVRLKGYTPIFPLEVLRGDTSGSDRGGIKLDGNENPYGCSPRVRQALASFHNYHIYPDPEHRRLREALQAYVGVSAEHIVAGSGSDELIDLVLRLFLAPGDEVVNCIPTFGMYQFNVELCGGKVVRVARDEAYDVDVSAVKEAVGKRTKLIFISSPNNPTGNLMSEEKVLELLDTGKIVLVDEAYHEFCGKSVVGFVPKYENLIVLRTFSKWAGLAGLRVGYGVFPSKVVEYIWKIKQPYNVNAAAQVAALESLADIEHLRAVVQAIVTERERLFQRLGELEFLRPYPSQANFILCKVVVGDARRIYTGLRERGIFVRYFDAPLLTDCLRISVGKPEHTDALIKTLKELGG
ncbi:MAG: histidinol-phosphate transaminase [Chloroflexi bacterium]|nr:histidinol-phosphate transaminase [Chloroflexota bacterium]